MVLMSLFCFVCSVRLGAIIIACVSLLEVLIPIIFLFALGSDYFKEYAIKVQSNQQNYYPQFIFDHTVLYLKNDSSTFVIGFIIFLLIHLMSCFLLIYGTLKLNKWMLLPYIVMELIRLLIVSAVHIVGMMVIKKQMNLGVLITVTITGGFGLLLLFYMWSCIIALFQIIIIVNTENYKKLYGERNSLVDSNNTNLLFTNTKNVNNDNSKIESVKVFPLSDFKKISFDEKYYNKHYYNNKNAYNNNYKNNKISQKNYDITNNKNMLYTDFNELQNREFLNYSNNRYKFNDRY